MATRAQLEQHRHDIGAIAEMYTPLTNPSNNPDKKPGPLGYALANHLRNLDAALAKNAKDFPDWDLDGYSVAPNPASRSYRAPAEVRTPFIPAIASSMSATFGPPDVDRAPEPPKLGRFFSSSDSDTWAQRANEVQKQLEDTRSLPEGWRRAAAARIMGAFCAESARRLPPDQLRALRERMEAIADTKKN